MQRGKHVEGQVRDAGQADHRWLIASALSFLAACTTIKMTSNGHEIANIWPANAILVALFLVEKTPRWRTVLTGAFVTIAANCLTRGTVAGPMLYGIANIVEIGLAASLLRKRGWPDNILHSTKAVAYFIVVAGLLAPLVSGAIGSLTAHLVYGEPIAKSLITWVASDGLGLLVFTPVSYALLRGDFVTFFRSRTLLQKSESVGWLVATGYVAYWIFFAASHPLLFLLFPPLLILTFRVGPLGTKAGIMLVAIIGGVATMHGHGPVVLISPDPAVQAQAFQIFLAVTLLTCLPVAAETTARSRLTAELAEHDRKMTLSAMTDPLTGALNRGGFESAARKTLASAQACASVIAIDFDHFKQVNDRWGHAVGDLALKHLTSVLRSHIRARDLLGRIGGDEFMILLPDSSLDRTAAIAERIRMATYGLPMVIDDTNVTLVSLSIGVVSARPDEDYEALIQRADKAMYEAKTAGRNAIKAAA